VDGTTSAWTLVDATPAGEWTAISVSTTVSADTAIYKIGVNSLLIEFDGAAPVGSGATRAVANLDWTSTKSIGFWVYADKAFEAAQLVLYLTDATDPATFNTCAYATPNVWQYCEVDVTSLAGTQGDVVTNFDIRMAAGLPVPISIYVDDMHIWSAGNEVSLTVAAVADLGFMNMTTFAALVPGVNYSIAWRTGVDYAVILSDLDPDGAAGWVAY
jgi:hypothetical protein